MKLKKIILYLLSTVIVISLLMGLSLFIYANMPIQYETPSYDIQPGMSMTALAYDLKNHGIIRRPREFIILAKLLGMSNKIRAGEYEFPARITFYELLQKIVHGKIKYHKITFIEGTTFKQWLQLLQLYPELKHEIPNLSNEAILHRLNITESIPEGLLYPDTYYFVKGAADIDILLQAKQRMEKVLQQQWSKRIDDLPYETPYQALTAASLIEKETANKDEKYLIAGILIQRLEKKMRLQFDPSVIYGLGDAYQSPLTRQQLRIDTPYNTYMHKGLPPTPITMPSAESIQAALNPEASEYIYFVAKGNGSHVFSSTLEEHRIAVEEYRHSQRK